MLFTPTHHHHIFLRLCSCCDHRQFSSGFLFSFFGLCLQISSLLPPHNLTFHVLCSCTTLFFPVPLLVKCVYTKPRHQINPAKLLRSIPQPVTVEHANSDGGFLLALYFPHLWRLVFDSHSTPFSVSLCSHTQWRPFLPGLKYEVIDSAYISLYTGKNS